MLGVVGYHQCTVRRCSEGPLRGVVPVLGEERKGFGQTCPESGTVLVLMMLTVWSGG